MVTITKAQAHHIPAIIDLTQRAILQTAAVAYSPEQLNVWAKALNRPSLWENVIRKQVLLVAMEQDRLAGIISLEKGYYIDFLYVHPDFGRQGIARALLNAIITHADQGWLEVFASKLARPFFENHGFEVVHDNKVHLDGQVLINYKMMKEPI